MSTFPSSARSGAFPIRARVLAVACVATLLIALGPLASRAAADTIGISGGTLIYGPEGVEALSLLGSIDGTDLVVTGTTAGLAIVTPGCVADGATSVRCALAGFSVFEIIGSIFDDIIDMTAVSVDLIVWGNGGDDVIIGGSGDDVLFGGIGDDVVMGGDGDDVLFGEPGDDVLLGDGGDDVLLGGAGNDVLIGGDGDNVIIQGDNENEPASQSPSPLPRPRDVPEPGTSLLLLSGAVSAFVARRSRIRR